MMARQKVLLLVLVWCCVFESVYPGRIFMDALKKGVQTFRCNLHQLGDQFIHHDHIFGDPCKAPDLQKNNNGGNDQVHIVYLDKNPGQQGYGSNTHQYPPPGNQYESNGYQYGQSGNQFYPNGYRNGFNGNQNGQNGNPYYPNDYPYNSAHREQQNSGYPYVAQPSGSSQGSNENGYASNGQNNGFGGSRGQGSNQAGQYPPSGNQYHGYHNGQSGSQPYPNDNQNRFNGNQNGQNGKPYYPNDYQYNNAHREQQNGGYPYVAQPSGGYQGSNGYASNGQNNGFGGNSEQGSRQAESSDG